MRRIYLEEFFTVFPAGGWGPGPEVQNLFIKMMGATKFPPVLYAQDKNSIFLTINLQDCKVEELVGSETGLTFKGKSHETDYAWDLKLYDNVQPEVF